ncbi:interleukin-1 beta isoform X1 [Mugil cephalus]|uniref:interleukin-1 beta isoform X1 n=1 Tax=Mugil cephalus TaxID=48193 RepID=UPI001FB5ED10|nr:interleukin-1 beta isoform X1 [Mugil cephalus]
MSTLDLADALDSSSEGEREVESCCFDTKDVQDVQEETFQLDEGLDLKVSCGRNMKSVATLVLVVNALKKFLTHGDRALSDGELCSAIMDKVVEEVAVMELSDHSTGVGQCFRKWRSMKGCELRDSAQRDIIHRCGEYKLQAITLKGGNSEHKVTFKMSSYIPTNRGSCSQIVALSIHNNLYMSCSMNNNKVTLNLEECHENLQEIEGNMDRLLFYKITTELDNNMFESVKYPGWCISTSNEHENESMDMCTVDNTTRCTRFKLNPY